MNHVGDLLNKYKCYVMINFSIIVVLVILYFVYVFMHMYVYVYIMLYMFGYKLWEVLGFIVLRYVIILCSIFCLFFL